MFLLIFVKVQSRHLQLPSILNREGMASSIFLMVLEELESHLQKSGIGPQIIPLTIINSKWIKDLHVRSEAVKLLKENIGEKLLDTSLSNNFFFGFDSKSTSNKSKN